MGGPAPDLVFEGEVCIDGSGNEPLFPELNRIGWAAAMVNDQGVDVGSAFGPVPVLVQEIGAAELWALLMVLDMPVARSRW